MSDQDASTRVSEESTGNQPREVLPISYAQAGEQVALDVKPLPLLLPNVASIVTVFLKLTTTQSPMDTVIEGVRSGRMNAMHFWDSMLTAPMLLSIPLAIWTVRLCISPLVRRAEHITAWAISGSAMAMTMLCIGFCGWIALHQHGAFSQAAITSILALGVMAYSLVRLRPLMKTYVPALIGMTGAFAIESLLIVLVVVEHFPWKIGTIVDLLIAVAQFAAMAWTVRCYRRELEDSATFTGM